MKFASESSLRLLRLQDICPSDEFASPYFTDTPAVFGAVVACTFVMVAVVFFVYDIFVQRRNNKLIVNAARSNAVVTALFPGSLRDRVLEQNAIGGRGAKSKMKTLLAEGTASGGHAGSPDSEILKSQPLADLFLETTVLFADIVGFTAWSSVREPSQVFTLLETAFSAFDDLARHRRVFKVETVVRFLVQRFPWFASQQLRTIG